MSATDSYEGAKGLADVLEHLLQEISIQGEGEWMEGQAGHADLVHYNGEDIVGIANFGSPHGVASARIKLVAELRNNLPTIIAALRERHPPEHGEAWSAMSHNERASYNRGYEQGRLDATNGEG